MSHTISVLISGRLAERLRLSLTQAGITEQDLINKAILDFVERTEVQAPLRQTPGFQRGTLTPMTPPPTYVGDPPPGTIGTPWTFPHTLMPSTFCNSGTTPPSLR